MKIRFLTAREPWGRQLQTYFEENWEETQVQEKELSGSIWLDIHSRSGLNEGAAYTINPPEALRNALEEERSREIFRLNRLPSAAAGEEAVRVLEAWVLDQNLIFLRTQQENGKWKYLQPMAHLLIVELAKRAAYLLGLDFAQVRIILNPRRRYLVESVSPFPPLKKKDFLTLTHYIETLKQSLPNTGGEAMLGADPEFMLSNSRSGKMMFASDFFPRDGIAGCDAVRSRSQHKRPVAEVRPMPDHSPLLLTENIRMALQEAGRMAPYRHMKWLAGSQPFAGYSTGGHVHFSQLAFNGHLLRALDVYAALPFFLVEAPDTAALRRRRYGMLGDYRLKTHGGFEYRTLASWLISPQWTAAALCLCKVVARSYPVLKSTALLTPERQQAFYQGDRELFREIVLNELYPELTSLTAYTLYQDPLEWLFDQIRNRKHWNEKQDIRVSWGIYPEKTGNKPGRESKKERV